MPTSDLPHSLAPAPFPPALLTPATAEEHPALELLALNEDLARDLGLDPTWLRSDEGLAYLTGHHPDFPTQAQVYAGMQFGTYVPRLGDGRALLLDIRRTPSGSTREIHLKGSGPTPLSRGGDGRAPLSAALREYIMSEYLHACGVPTTRALAVFATGRRIHRATPIPQSVTAGMIVRVAPTFLRVGSAQYTAHQHPDLLPELIAAALPHARARSDWWESTGPAVPPSPFLADASSASSPAAELWHRVAECQLRLVSRWIRMGFVHGVLNTDNVSLCGDTLDFGPCAMLDSFRPGAVFSSIDRQGRYAFDAQPGVTVWNLARFAEALLPQWSLEEAQEAVAALADRYRTVWVAEMAWALGLGEHPDEEAVALCDEAVTILAEESPDYHRWWRTLAASASPAEELGPAWASWVQRWLERAPDREAMAARVPVIRPRNVVLQDALDAAAAGDVAPALRVLRLLGRPWEAPSAEDAVDAEDAEDAAWWEALREGSDSPLRAAGRAVGPDADSGFRTYCGT